MLSADSVLTRFDSDLHIGISCDALESGFGVVLFHRYPDGRERPSAYVLKTMTNTQVEWLMMIDAY